MDKEVTSSKGPLLDEVWDSPLGGAYLIWRFVKGYTSKSATGPSAVLVFPALAIVMDSYFSSEVSRAANLADFAFAFHDSSGKMAKSLAGLQDRILELRDWGLKSLEFAMVTRLVELDVDTGRLGLALIDEVNTSAKLARGFKDNEGFKAEHLGEIFAKTKDTEIPYYLGVKF